MSLATGRSFWTSGRVSAWNSSRRSSVRRDSRWKVGRIVKLSASASSASASAPKVASEPVIAPASSWSRSETASKTVPVSRTRPFRESFWPLRISSVDEASVMNGPMLPNASFRSSERPLTATAADCCHCWKAVRVSGSSALKISSIWVALRVGRHLEGAVLLDRLDVLGLGVGHAGCRAERDVVGLAGLRAGRELDVGLAQERLLAQDRPGVFGDRRELGTDLEHGLGRVVALDPLVRGRQADLLHLADGDAADPDVGLGRELRGLGEVGRDAVALRLQRDRTAERDPQEHDQEEAGDREACGDEDAAD